MLGSAGNRRDTTRGPVGVSIGGWRLAIFIVGCFGALVVLITTSESFEHCIQQSKNHHAYHALHEERPLFVKTIARLELHAACARVTAGENDGAIVAIGTVVLAFFTFTLWRATTGLWETTEREFISAHPPHLIVRRVSLDEGSGYSAGISRPWKIQYIIANTGLGEATAFEGNASVALFENGPPAIPPFADECDIDLPIHLASGESVPRFVYLPKPIIERLTAATWDEAMRKIAPNGNSLPNCVYFFGYILYRDDIGVIRRTAFCRLYDFATKRFTIVQDPDYEYS